MSRTRPYGLPVRRGPLLLEGRNVHKFTLKGVYKPMVIAYNQSDDNNSSTDKLIDSYLDELVGSMRSIYSITPEDSIMMKDGLTSVVQDYLNDFIINNKIKLLESNGVNINILSYKKSELIRLIIESLKINNVVNLTYKGSIILTLINMDGTVTYSIGGKVSIDKLNSDNLITAWKNDIENLKPLILDIVSQFK
jgi:hypothetical protein